MAAERVKRLKDLVDRLERLPASEDRDRVLSEVRSRAVDLDTGVTPRAMLPLREPILAEPAPRRYRPASITRTVVAPSARPVETAPPAVAANDHDEWLSIGPLLSLDDASEPHVQGPGGQSVPPWTLGLRG